MNLRLSLFCLLGLVTSSCAILNPSSRTTPGARISPSRSLVPPLGSVDGQELRLKDVPPSYLNRIREVENDAAQRKMHLTWAGIEEAIDERVLGDAAKKANTTAKALLEKHVDSQLREPSEEELKILYSNNEASLDVDYDLAKPYIRNRLRAQQRAELKSVFLGSLREGRKITNKIPIPHLPRVKLNVSDEPSLGPLDAPVTLIQYSDFQCPYCARSRELLDELRSRYPDDLRIVFRSFPLEQHPHAKRAAKAAQCAHQQSQFWKFHDLLFSHQADLKEPDLIKYARRIGLDIPAFQACLGGNQVTELIDKAYRFGVAIGVKGTPAIYINGIKLVGLLPLPLITAIIDKEIGR